MSPLQSSAHTPSLVVERYRLLRRIGEMESTENWEALDTRLDRPVSLRLLAGHARNDPDARARLRAAARKALLDHDTQGARVLDGGDDPMYGPFVVAERNNAMEATQPLTVVGPSPTSDSAAIAGRSTDTPAGSAFVRRPAPPTGELTAALQLRRHLVRPVIPGTSGVRLLAVLALGVLAVLVLLPRALVPTEPSSVAPATAVTAEQAAVGSPVGTIRQHYALIGAKRYADGYALMDRHLRSLNSPADYAGWFVNKVAIAPISVDLRSQTDRQAVVRAVVHTVDHMNGKDVTTRVTEQFVLVNEDGAWRIHQVSRI